MNLTRQAPSPASSGNAPALWEALAEAKSCYATQHKRSHEMWLEARQVMPGGNTRTTLYFDPFPIYMASGEGCTLVDVDGHMYTDFLAEYTCGIYGHSDPVICKALTEALGRGLSLSAHNGTEIELARLICARFESIEQVRFTNSGTEANLMAIATAVQFTRRRRVMVFEGAYHGALLTFGAQPTATTVPHDFIVAPYNDIEGARSMIRQAGTELAAIIVEPMLGASGCIPGSPDFLAMLVAEARAVGAVSIFDEVQTSRLSIGGRQQLLGLRPDMTTLGKYFGGGLSFGAFGGRAELMALYDPGLPGSLSHSGTFNNNTLSMAAGHAGLSKVLTEGALQALNSRGDRLRERLTRAFNEAGTPFYVTGLGSIMSFHAAASPTVARKAVELLFFELLARGSFCAPRGLVALSLPIGERELDALLDAVRDVLMVRKAAFAFCTS